MTDMIGVFTLFKDNQNYVDKKQIRFEHIPDGLSDDEIKIRFSKLALDFANAVDSNRVYLLYGKDNTIEYEFKI